MIHAPTTGGVELSARILTVAVTGPSDTSSYQSGLPQKFPIPEPTGEADLPKPPSTSKWFSVSLRISPRGTVVVDGPGNVIWPLSNSFRCPGPLNVRAPGSIVRSLAEPALPRPGLTAFLLAKCTVQVMSASALVISSTVPSS